MSLFSLKSIKYCEERNKPFRLDLGQFSEETIFNQMNSCSIPTFSKQPGYIRFKTEPAGLFQGSIRREEEWTRMFATFPHLVPSSAPDGHSTAISHCAIHLFLA